MKKLQEIASEKQKTASVNNLLLHVAKGSGILFTGKLLAHVIKFITVFLIARLLMAEEFGRYNLALSVVMLVAGLSVLGFNTCLARYSSIYSKRNDTVKLVGTLQLCLGVPTLFGLLLTVALYFCASPVATVCFHDPELIPVIKLGCLIIPFLSLNLALTGAVKGLSQINQLVIADSLFLPSARLVMVTLFSLLIGIDALWAVASYHIALFGSTMLLLFFVHERVRLGPPSQIAEIDVKEILTFSLPVYLSKILLIIRKPLQTFLLGSLSSLASVGVFAIATQINILGRFFHNAVVTSSMPVIAAIHSEKELDQLRLFYQTTSKWTLTLNLPLFLILILFPVEILSIFGSSFESGVSVVMILAWTNLINTGTGLCGVLLDMSGHTTIRLVNSFFISVCTIGLNLWLIPAKGMIGAAWAVLSVELIANTLRICEIYFLYRILPFNISFLKPVAAGCCSLVSIIVIESFFSSTSLFFTAFKALILAMIFVGAIMALGFSAEDQMVLSTLKRKTKHLISSNRPG